jgi:hypothetical protein
MWMLSLSLLALLAASPAHAEEGVVSMGTPTSDYYVIQPGDTLWSISSRFLNDSYAWPQLWSLNEYITNPHWIYPGNRIYFRLQDHLTPPSAQPDDVPAENVRVAQAAAADACDFPARFNEAQAATSMQAPGVIGTADELNIRGKITAADEPGTLLGAPSYVYLNVDDDADTKCGDTFSVFRMVQKKVKANGSIVGSMYRILGEVQVIRVDDKVATARIRNSYSEIERGDVVGDLVPVGLTVDVKAPTGDLEANIFARLTTEQILANIQETVFLDRGTADGIKVGSSLYVVERRDPIHLDDRSDETLPERVVGRVVVVRATEDSSTAIVVNAARDVQVGQHLTTTPNKSENGER